MPEFPTRYTYLNQLFAGSHPVVKLFLVFSVIVTSFILLSFVSIVLAIPIFNISINDIETLFKGNLLDAKIPLLKYLQITQSLAVFVIPSIILSYLLFSNKSDLFLNTSFPSAGVIVLILVIMYFLIPSIDKLVEWNHAIKFPSALAGLEEKITRMEDDAGKLTERLLSGRKWFDLAINLIMIAIIPAIGEEFLFRGILQKIFHEWTKRGYLAIIISAIIFSSVHMQFFGFVPRLLLGILFGYLFYWSRNIWVAVFAHFFNNAIAVVLQYTETTNKSPDILLRDSSDNGIRIILSLFIAIIGIYLVKRKFTISAEG